MVNSSAPVGAPPSGPVIVIGGGVIGCAAAYHLLRMGVREVTLVDRIGPGAGTTKAGAGFVALWASGATRFGLSGHGLERYALEFYRELETFGARLGYRSNGNVVLMLGEPGWKERGVVLQDRLGALPARALSAVEVAELTGVVDVAKVDGGILMPSGIQVETERVIGALTDQLRQLGATIVTDTGVTGFDTAGNSIRAVQTTAGTLDAAAVVIAAGAWTNQVLAGLNSRLPLLPVLATRIVTDDRDVPETMPTIQCPELRLWIRGADGAFTWGTLAGYEPLYEFGLEDGSVPPELPRREDVLERLLDAQPAVAEVFPTLAGARVERWLQGIINYTPDGNLIIGHVPGFANAVVLAGDNESGVSHGPAMGRVGAELLCDAEPLVDLEPMRPDRFAPSDFPDARSVLEQIRASGSFLGEIGR